MVSRRCWTKAGSNLVGAVVCWSRRRSASDSRSQSARCTRALAISSPRDNGAREGGASSSVGETIRDKRRSHLAVEQKCAKRQGACSLHCHLHRQHMIHHVIPVVAVAFRRL